MATLTVECERGTATIEADGDEAPASVAARLAEAIDAAGGRKGERREIPRQLTRGEQMDRWQLIECARCRMWLPPTQAAAARHNRKYHEKEAS